MSSDTGPISVTRFDDSLEYHVDHVVLRVDADIDLLALHRACPDRYPHLLESVACGNPQARFDILFAFPGSTLALDKSGTVTIDEQKSGHQTFLAGFDAWWQRERCKPDSTHDLPFRGGWFVYLGYELVAEIEPRLRLKQGSGPLPAAFATRFYAAVIRDRAQRSVSIVAEPGHEGKVRQIGEDLRISAGGRTAAVVPPVFDVTEDDPGTFLRQVGRIKQYIRDGDVFQVNLSRAWRMVSRTDFCATDVYSRLRTTNPAPFSGIATWRDCAILSSSPERLVRVAGGTIQTRPIAGTRPRGATAEDDSRLSASLLAHPKERAEHVMLIDLERNDLGRVCKPGTVRVDELMTLESYAHVHHIVSNITGQLDENVTPGQVIRAVFPGGTITGCPKVRCMEIIAELEQTARGPYTGSFGYINRDGSLDTNILIRTIVKEGRRLTLRAGAGIVADSIPRKELDETRAKARGLLLAIEEETH
ncbi:MAG: hypothetical protein FD165_283 [Gammaproteobacteria bacterium]|nr:MAG: hypothetical protein FD165_283 [Gammaproteobacteria bacterium]TND06862.1 MAG: hypothetical protein FD120_594 [Gammaproteobacteria bacterium]